MLVAYCTHNTRSVAVHPPEAELPRRGDFVNWKRSPQNEGDVLLGRYKVQEVTWEINFKETQAAIFMERVSI
jgi:hypothetical protein